MNGLTGRHLLIGGGIVAAMFLAYRYGTFRSAPAAKPPAASVEELRTRLTADGPAADRASAAEALGHARDFEAMPDLIRALEDPDVRVRGRAGAAVAAMLRADFGFRAGDPPEQRQAAVAQIRRCWEQLKGKEFPGK